VVQGVVGLQASNQELAEQAAARDANHFEAVVQGVAGLQASNQELAEQAAARDASLIKAIEPLGDIASFTGQSNQLLADFTGKSRENQIALQQAGETMGTAAQQVATAASSLETVVDNLSREMSEVLQSVKTDLNGVMTGMNQDFTRNLSGMANQMEGATNKLADIMESVKADLGGTIQIMSDGFKQNMVGMAGDLRQATDNISTSIGGMSETVNKAMEEVAKNIDNASQVQKNTSVQFSGMSAGLSASVEVMTANMDAIGTRMEEGLGSVASSSQQIGGLARNFKVIAQSIETLPATLQQIAEGVGNSSASVSRGLDQVVAILNQSDRYSSAADAVMKMPDSIDELSSRLAQPRDELVQMQKSLTQLVEVANGINDRVQDFKPAEDLQEA
jgi:methyl-accepting chemotaxis protein